MSKITATKKQSKIVGKDRITATASLTYLKGNPHSYFSVTGEIASKYRPQCPHSCGCIHEDITENFPGLRKYIKWHLTDSTGTPMHYVANAMYFFKQKDWKAFESTCKYGTFASDSDFNYKFHSDVKVREWLEYRQPMLKQAFVADMIELFPHLTETDFA